MNIYVSNLSWNTSIESLEELFSKYGEITSANIITDRETGRSRGFGFIEMPNDEEGQKAIDELDNTELDGKVITVNIARPKAPRSSSGFRGGNREGYGRDNRGGYGRDNRGGGNNGGYNRKRY